MEPFPGNGRYHEPLSKADETYPSPAGSAETEKAFIVKVELPEVEKKDIDISVNQGLLTIRGERKREKEEKSKRFHRIERSFGSFSRSFRFPNDIEEDKIEANFKDGVLQITLPKSAKAKQKQISINIK